MSKLYYLNWKKPFRSIKYIIQRIKYGWCEADAWGASEYFDDVLVNVLRQLAKDTICYPLNYNFSDWKTEIGDCASKIERAYNLEQNCDPLPEGTEARALWYRVMKAQKEEAHDMRKEAFEWLADHWTELWW